MTPHIQWVDLEFPGAATQLSPLWALIPSGIHCAISMCMCRKGVQKEILCPHHIGQGVSRVLLPKATHPRSHAELKKKFRIATRTRLLKYDTVHCYKTSTKLHSVEYKAVGISEESEVRGSRRDYP